MVRDELERLTAMMLIDGCGPAIAAVKKHNQLDNRAAETHLSKALSTSITNTIGRLRKTPNLLLLPILDGQKPNTQIAAQCRQAICDYLTGAALQGNEDPASEMVLLLSFLAVQSISDTQAVAAFLLLATDVNFGSRPLTFDELAPDKDIREVAIQIHDRIFKDVVGLEPDPDPPPEGATKEPSERTEELIKISPVDSIEITPMPEPPTPQPPSEVVDGVHGTEEGSASTEPDEPVPAQQETPTPAQDSRPKKTAKKARKAKAKTGKKGKASVS